MGSKDKLAMELSVLSGKACKIFFISMLPPQGGGSLVYIEGVSLFVGFMPVIALQLQCNSALQVNLY